MHHFANAINELTCKMPFFDQLLQLENIHLRGSVTVRMTSCLTSLDSAALLMFNQQQIYLFGQIQTSQTGQPNKDTSPYEVSECSLLQPSSGFYFVVRLLLLLNYTQNHIWMLTLVAVQISFYVYFIISNKHIYLVLTK